MLRKIILNKFPIRSGLLSQCNYYSKCITVKEINDLVDLPADVVCVKGWIRSLRSHKEIVFLDLYDGSQFSALQAVVPVSEYKSEATYGSSVEVYGRLERRSSAKQQIELQASKLNIIGPCDEKEYPIKMGQKHSNDYLRSLPHLKFRTRTHTSLLKISNAASFSVEKYFQKENFCKVDVPRLTSNDCEGGGEVFQVEPIKKLNSSNPNKRFFGVPTYLTVSGQLHLEAALGAHSRVYCFGPTFRAEPSHTRHHLSEFQMIEAEIAFVDEIRDLCECIEDLLKNVVGDVLSTCKDEVDFFLKKAKPGHADLLENLTSKKFRCVTYTEAIDILSKSKKKFRNKIFWGTDLHKEHEQHLVGIFQNVPVFVADYPAAIKPFYSKDNGDGKTVASLDLLFPEVGEVCGGSLREHRLDVLERKLKDFPQSLGWYLDLRRFGSVPHGGFGIGFERVIQMLLGLDNIKDALPFHRSAGSCKL